MVKELGFSSKRCIRARSASRERLVLRSKKKKKSVFLDKAQVFMQNIKSVFVVLKFHNGDWEGVGGGQRWYE